MRICKLVYSALVIGLVSCSGGDKTTEEKPGIKLNKNTATEKTIKSKSDTFSYLTADFESKGIGPVTTLELNQRIDKEMAEHGEAIYMRMCAACHRTDKKFIGPEMKGLLDRRTPEWIMNTLLDPEGMIKNDSLTKKIFAEFNNVLMPNQNPTEEEARAMLEYFRTLK